jgi:hypothetical protein
MVDLGLAVFLAIIAAGIGKRMLGFVRELPEHPLDAMALAVPVGLGSLALGCLAVGEFGQLNLAGLAVLLAVAAEVGLLAGLRLFQAAATHRERGADRPPACRLGRLIGCLLVLTIAATAVAAMVPVTDGDALCYHLQVPKVFLIRQAVYFDPDLHETVYPLASEMLYSLGLEFRGPIACRCIQWVLGLVFAANVTALARPSLGPRASWAGLVALLVPAVSNGMAAPLNDVALAAFGTAALVAWTRHADRPSVAGALVAGMACGLAMGVKYPALVLGVLLCGLTVVRPWLYGTWRSRGAWYNSVGHGIAFLGAAALAGGAWYLRAYVHTGNPVYPFFRELFAGAGLAEVLAPIKRPLPVGVWNLLTSLAPLTIEPHRFDSFAHQFGPIFLLFLPALFLERAPRRVLGLVCLGYVFLILCMSQRQSMRFLLIGLGPMSVGVAYLASRWYDRETIPARALTAALALVLCLEAGLATARAGRAAGVVLGKETCHEFLGRCEPTYRVGKWVSEHLPAAARLIGQDHRGFYIPRAYTMELAHRRRTGLGKNGESPGEIVETLKHEGYTHVMLCPPVPERAVEFDPTLGRLLSSWLMGREPVYREDLADGDGVVRRYSIYELVNPAMDGTLGVRKREAVTR